MEKNKINQITVSEFFSNEYPAYASYDNVRKLSSIVDGLKLSQRKVVYTILHKMKDVNTELKTSRLANIIAEYTEYLHGENSLTGVLESMASKYVGSNNFPLLGSRGNFGNRYGGGIASAPRYTYIKSSKLLFDIFDENDNCLCPSQIFEGTPIEPKFFVPKIPYYILNGMNGLTSGWRAFLFPRNPKEVIDYIILQLKGEGRQADEMSLNPFICNYNGIFRKSKINSFVNEGVFKINGNKIIIEELPLAYSHLDYLSVLNKLVESDIIVSFEDLADPKQDILKYEIKVKPDFFERNKTDDDILTTLKLKQNVTEYLNFIDPQDGHTVRSFNSVKDVIKEFISFRLEYYEKRIKYMIDEISLKLLFEKNKLKFISLVLNKKLDLRKFSTEQLTERMKTDKFDMKDNSFNYLFSIPISSFTVNKIKELENRILEFEKHLEHLKKTTPKRLMISELTNLKNDF